MKDFEKRLEKRGLRLGRRCSAKVWHDLAGHGEERNLDQSRS